MARTDQHGAYAFLIYYSIWIIWKRTFIIGGEFRYLVLMIVIFGLFPDFDAIYYLIKKRGEGGIDTQFQHHLYFWTHWPISYFPLIIVFIISLIFNFCPEWFLVPVIGIYCGHLIFDSISCGDGVMWGKIPWKKDRYARYLNLFPSVSDGYHGVNWDVRYRKTVISKIGNIAVILSILIIILFQIIVSIEHFNAGDPPGISGYYILPIIFFVITLILGMKKVPAPLMKAFLIKQYNKAAIENKKEYDKETLNQMTVKELKKIFIENRINIPDFVLEEPQEGRYADYRTNPKYINGLSDKNKKKHIDKYKELLEKKGIMDKIKN